MSQLFIVKAEKAAITMRMFYVHLGFSCKGRYTNYSRRDFLSSQVWVWGWVWGLVCFGFWNWNSNLHTNMVALYVKKEECSPSFKVSCNQKMRKAVDFFLRKKWCIYLVKEILNLRTLSNIVAKKPKQTVHALMLSCCTQKNTHVAITCRYSTEENQHCAMELNRAEN